MTTPPKARYGIYYTPAADHPLTRVAARWLGRDAFGGRALMPGEAVDGWRELTAAPRHYGFHATLKAPFRLADGAGAIDLQEAVWQFAAGRSAAPLGRLKVARIGRFFALVPEETAAELMTLAGAAVTEFDRFRAPMGEEEFARRNAPHLDPAEVAHLRAWGYPYVLERYRFHMTLTGPVAPERQDEVLTHLKVLFAPLLCEDFTVDALTIYVEEPGEDFLVMSRAPLG